MNATEITTIAGIVIALIGSVIIPLVLNRVKDQRQREHAEGLDSRSVAQMFKQERDSLQERLDKVVVEYESKLTALKAEYERKLAESEAKYLSQIAGLRAEIDALYRRLYQPPPGM